MAAVATTSSPRFTNSARDLRPLSERVYEQLRDQIVTGELPADSKVHQEAVAAEMGVSRTPVREALSRLAQEDLVTLVPGNGYLVNELLDEDVSNVYEVRQSLEVSAARLACRHHNRLSIARLEVLVEEMRAADPSDASVQFELNRRFHYALNEPCGNPLMMKMIDALWDHPIHRRITTAYIQGGDNTAETVAEHCAIVDAVRANDEALLVDIMTKHLTVREDLMDAVHAHQGRPSPHVSEATGLPGSS